MKHVLLTGSEGMKTVKTFAPTSLDYVDDYKTRIKYTTISGTPVAYVTKDGTLNSEFEAALVIPNVNIGEPNGQSGLPYIPYSIDKMGIEYALADPTATNDLVSHFRVEAVEMEKERNNQK